MSRGWGAYRFRKRDSSGRMPNRMYLRNMLVMSSNLVLWNLLQYTRILPFYHEIKYGWLKSCVTIPEALPSLKKTWWAFEQKPLKKCIFAYFNPRTDGGGYPPPPPWGFSWTAEKTAARGAAKFCMTIYLSILRVVCKWWSPTIQGQVTRSLGMTRCQVTFLHTYRCARAAVDDQIFWNSVDGVSP